MTKNHRAPPDDMDASLFLDADLFILGAFPEHYAGYSEAIRKEYAWVPERDYLQGRRKVLQGFLQRPTIYQSDWLKPKLEEKARANIAAEMAQIDERMRTLPP